MLGEMFKLKLNYKTHINTLPTTLKQALLLPDLLYAYVYTLLRLMEVDCTLNLWAMLGDEQDLHCLKIHLTF